MCEASAPFTLTCNVIGLVELRVRFSRGALKKIPDSIGLNKPHPYIVLILTGGIAVATDCNVTITGRKTLGGELSDNERKLAGRQRWL